MRWLKNLTGLLGLAALVGGVPWLLIVLMGNPFDKLADITLDAPISGDVILGLIAVAIWALWAAQMLCLVAEVITEARGREIELPVALGGPQAFARLMIGLLLAGTTISTTAAGASDAHAAEPVQRVSTASAAGAQTASAAQSTPQAAATADATTETTTVTVVVRQDDSLWQLAEKHLGDGTRWTEIRDLNEGRGMVDGVTFSKDLQPGWKLLVPTSEHNTLDGPDATESVDIVQPNETLSHLSLEHLGDAERYMELFEASRNIDQPGGAHLTNPDHIEPGWKIRIPTDRAAEPAPDDRKAEPAPDDRKAEPAPDQEQKEPPTSHAAPAPPSAQHQRDTSTPGLADATPKPAPDQQVTPAASVDDSETLPGWVMPGLLGGGTLLAGAAYLLLKKRRGTQNRRRQPGGVFEVPTPEISTVEKSVNIAGIESASIVELIDQAMRRAAAALIELQRPMPGLAAVEVTPHAIAFHLRRPAPAPAGTSWAATDDEQVWIVARDASPVDLGPYEVDTPPWPLLVTLGEDRRRGTWLLNVEGLNVAVAGDQIAADDLARHVAAQLACNPWSRETAVDLVGVGSELAPISPDRVRTHDQAHGPASQAIADAVSMIDRLSDYDTDGPTARATGEDPDVWPSRALIIDQSAAHTDTVRQLEQLIRDKSNHTGTALVLNGVADADACTLTIDEHRHLVIESVNLEVNACGLTRDEAIGCAALLAHPDLARETTPPDLLGDETWKTLATTTGSLREEYRVERGTSAIEPVSSILNATDAAYTQVGATTPSDLNALAPNVTKRVQQEITGADPDLNSDLEEWNDENSPKPRLRVLGPVEAWATGTPPKDKKAAHLEMFTYLATRENGATSDQAADAFGRPKSDIAKMISGVRDWCGVDPETGEKYVPPATRTKAAQARGIGVYQMVDVLTDLDLFRRLRIRAAGRGADGIEDLWAALELVAGRPFDQLRPHGWGWLLEGDRLDDVARVAIADVAHTIVLHELQHGAVDQARRAVGIALAADPDSEVTRLDLAVVLKAQGHDDEARQVRDDICEGDTDDLPDDLPNRTGAIMRDSGWMDSQAI